MSAHTKPKFFCKDSNRSEQSSASKSSDSGTNSLLNKFSKKTVCITLSVLIILIAVFMFFSNGLIGTSGGSGNVEFTPLSAEQIPRSIEKDVIPEYRELERALGCLVDGKVYIVVTRGEKPTAGYEVSIEKLKLEKSKNGSNLAVTALFTEPPADKSVSRIITYPYAVAATELESLPDTIELNVRYAE